MSAVFCWSWPFRCSHEPSHAVRKPEMSSRIDLSNSPSPSSAACGVGGSVGTDAVGMSTSIARNSWREQLRLGKMIVAFRSSFEGKFFSSSMRRPAKEGAPPPNKLFILYKRRYAYTMTSHFHCSAVARNILDPDARRITIQICMLPADCLVRIMEIG